MQLVYMMGRQARHLIPISLVPESFVVFPYSLQSTLTLQTKTHITFSGVF